YEAITDTYIPLLNILENLLNDRIDFRITLSLTPTLLEMFNDSLLISRYQRHMDNLIELTEKEVFRTRNDVRFNPVVRMYLRKFLDTKRRFEYTYSRDLTAAFRSLYDSGRIELITSAATHAYLPAIITEYSAARAQILIGAESFQKNFSSRANGIWLPECGYTPGLDPLLKDAGLNFFFLESHGLLNETAKYGHSIYAPVKTPAGIVAFSRDAESSKQVWSAWEGYPGDPDYRDFYRDIGFDQDLDYLRPYLPDSMRTFTGLKYFRITGKTDNKEPYVPEKAVAKAAMHAGHFVKSRRDQALQLHEKLKIKPLITAAYDAELFGHWWFEGPAWLDMMFRKGASGRMPFRFITPSEYIAEGRGLETAAPSVSSWGSRGYSSTWIAPENSWIYRHLNRAARQMTRLAQENPGAKGLLKRSLNQSARELLLSQASDWAFMMKKESASAFATAKFNEHLSNFTDLHQQIVSGQIKETRLIPLELKNSLFSDLDFRIFGK
ncbi:MAG: DUF1957 domain-containing protein, partial [Nitrospirae bacterium]|nr:DUF1957 domain-containing protein [Nitrospirota bacterium]